MKQLITNYLFSPSTKQITLTDYTTISLNGLLLITNVTDNIIIYNFANQVLGGIVSGNVLTLTYDTVSMSSSDSLQIFYDNGETPASDESMLLLQEQNALLRRVVKLLEPSATVDINNRQRVVIDSGSISVGGTVALQNPAAQSIPTTAPIVVPLVWELMEASRNNYSNSIRKNLTFS